MSSYQIGIFISAVIVGGCRAIAHTAVRNKWPRWTLYVSFAVANLCAIAVVVLALLLVVAARAGRHL